MINVRICSNDSNVLLELFVMFIHGVIVLTDYSRSFPFFPMFGIRKLKSPSFGGMLVFYEV